MLMSIIWCITDALLQVNLYRLMSIIKTVLFDLDGTLIDTAPDMAAALVKLCEEEKQPVLEYKTIRPHVSNGSVALVKLAFGNQLDKHRLEQLKTRYLAIYKNNLAVESKLFDEMDAVLLELEKQQIKWGVVTNKPGWLTLPLMQALKLDKRATCIVSADSTKNRKPHPEPMYYACKLSNSLASECLYIGDAKRDIEAGHNAGMKTMVALYGYISADDNPATWHAGFSIKKPADILTHLKYHQS